jgi:histidine triad (HIT) family protein
MNDISNCIFCKISRKEAPASVVYEDSKVMAFMDIRPVSEGHTLVIPKQHYEDIFSTPEELLAYTHEVTKRIAVAVKKVTHADGVSIVQQNGKAAGQDVFHLHIHIIPRFEGRKMPRSGELTIENRKNLELMATEIVKHL